MICPASKIDGVMDVAIKDGRIAAVQKDILPSSARKVTDVKGKLVLADGQAGRVHEEAVWGRGAATIAV